MSLLSDSKQLVWRFFSSAVAKATYESRLRAQENEMAGAQTLESWRRTRLGPPPGLHKASVVRGLAEEYGVRHFVETGTFTGLMVAEVADAFEQIDSIEIDAALYRRAKRRFKDSPHIRIHLGNSADVLPTLIADNKNAVLYWLDGHYSGGVTGTGPIDTPIVSEIGSILSSFRNDVVLIDDARLFNGRQGYPTVERLEEIVTRSGVGLRLELADDIIRLLPTAQQAR